MFDSPLREPLVYLEKFHRLSVAGISMANRFSKPIVSVLTTLVLGMFQGAVFPADAFQSHAAVNFSGEWKLDNSKSDFGGIPAPELLTRTIRHNDPALEISTHQKGAQGESTTQLKYTTDGKECINKLPTGDAKGTAKWQGYSLVIESSREFQGGVSKQREAWALSGGGKVLIIQNHVSGQREFDVKFVFEKQ
jgi:hypothetical protein